MVADSADAGGSSFLFLSFAAAAMETGAAAVTAAAVTTAVDAAADIPKGKLSACA